MHVLYTLSSEHNWSFGFAIYTRMKITFLKFFILAVTSIAVCWAGKIPALKHSEEVKPRYPFLEVDPLTARALLDNDFESGTGEPWYDSSPNTVHWVVEDFSSPSENYSPPAPLNGAKYLRATCNEQQTPGQVILRTVTFTAFPGDEISFNFWIRSKYIGGNTLEVFRFIKFLTIRQLIDSF